MFHNIASPHPTSNTAGLLRGLDEQEREALASIQAADDRGRDLDRILADTSAMPLDTYFATLRLAQSVCAERAAAVKLLGVVRSARWTLRGKPLCTRRAARPCRGDAPVRRHNRRVPRRTRTARTTVTASSSAGDGEPPEPEPPTPRRRLDSEVAL